MIQIRDAHVEDIAAMHHVRMSVKENFLSNRDLVTNNGYINHLNTRGKGWVCEIDTTIVGFAIVDLIGRSIWALFIHPEYESKGIGRKLHDQMLQWYFNNTADPVYLSTSPNTKAEVFYRKLGWKEVGITANGEIKFEMTIERWNR